MSVLRVCINSAVCSLQKTGIKKLRVIVPHVNSKIRNIWSIPRFQPIASAVLELQGISRGCSNKSSGNFWFLLLLMLLASKIGFVLKTFTERHTILSKNGF